MKSTNKSVMDRFGGKSESSKKKVEHLLSQYQKDRSTEVDVLKDEIKKLKEEQSRLQTKNPRGAGRKSKFNNEQAERIRNERKEGATIAALAQKHQCSAGLIHKLIHE